MIRFGAFTFDEAARELRRDGVFVPLSTKAFTLLETLIAARPNPVPHDVLYRQLWPDVIVEPGNLHGLVSEIRTAARTREIIRTVHRVGYAFTAIATSEDAPRFSILLGMEEIPLRSGKNLIGRDPRDAVTIHEPDVSRHHARLVVAGSTVTLEDLGSKNGTFVGTPFGARRVTTPIEVQPGDEILIGTTRLTLVRVSALATTV